MIIEGKQNGVRWASYPQGTAGILSSGSRLRTVTGGSTEEHRASPVNVTTRLRSERTRRFNPANSEIRAYRTQKVAILDLEGPRGPQPTRHSMTPPSTVQCLVPSPARSLSRPPTALRSGGRERARIQLAAPDTLLGLSEYEADRRHRQKALPSASGRGQQRPGIRGQRGRGCVVPAEPRRM